MKVYPKIMFVQSHHVLCRVLCTKRLSCFILTLYALSEQKQQLFNGLIFQNY